MDWLLPFDMRRPVGRRAFVTTGLVLALAKYTVEAAVLWALTGRRLTPMAFVSPSLTDRAELLQGAPEWLGWSLFFWSMPFVWIALSMSVRRAAAAGLSPWVGVAVLLPLVNLAVMATLSLVPDRPPRSPPTVRDAVAWGPGPAGFGGAGWQAVAAALAAGMLSFTVGVYGFKSYGAVLFFATPLVMGMVAGFLYNRPHRRSTAATLRIGGLVMLAAGGVLLALAFEGLICLMMAVPFVMPLSMAGAILGKWIAESTSAGLAQAAAVVLTLPLLAGAEPLVTVAPEYEVFTAVEVAAPPEVVWRRIVSFPDIPPPDDWFFRCGIACPLRARIEGTGVGAIRHCEFTTGDFVEPITVWDEPRRLAFDVAQQPDPMVELSPWRHVHPPHLHDQSLRSRRGEFRLIDLGGGRTRLEGRTWYVFAMHPQAYWTLWSDLAIHRIHRRVLDHIRTLAEADARREPAAGRSPENQVFQFMASESRTGPDGVTRTAVGYLWIPPACTTVRGVVVAGRNVPEHWLVGHDAIRRACAEHDLAILWCCPSFFDHRIEDGAPHADFLDQLLAVLARTSGYAEIAAAPWLPIGESMHLLMVRRVIKARPERCIAGIQIKNGSVEPPAEGVPMLLAVGTCDEWDQERKDLLEQWRTVGLQRALETKRAAVPQWPCSLLVEPGSGHFECTEAMAVFLADYIRAAAAARLDPAGGTTLRPVDLDAGTVARLPLPDTEAVPPEPFRDCQPDRRSLPWFFTAKLAQAAYAAAAVDWNARTQVPVFADAAGTPLPFGQRGIFSPLPYETEEDGITFRLHAGFLDRIPDGWVHGGATLGHATGLPVVEWICGPVMPLGAGRFQIALDRTWQHSPTFLRVWHPGDGTYRPAVQPGEIRLQPRTAGRPQSITFEPIPDQVAGTRELPLRATSDAGLPVRFFVRAGPAVVHGDRLVFTEIPCRSRLPLTVTVAAWQWGRTAEPAVQTAPIVERSFRIGAH